MEEFHDIRPPVMVGLDPLWVKAALFVLGIILLIAIVLLILKKIQKRKKSDYAQLPMGEGLTDPFDSAMKALDLLDASVHDSNLPRQLYFSLGDIVKTYIQKSHHIRAREMTTQELVESLRKTDIKRSIAIQVSKFQEECDPFRYAPDNMDFNHRIPGDIAQARLIIKAMKMDMDRNDPDEHENLKPKANHESFLLPGRES